MMKWSDFRFRKKKEAVRFSVSGSSHQLSGHIRTFLSGNNSSNAHILKTCQALATPIRIITERARGITYYVEEEERLDQVIAAIEGALLTPTSQFVVEAITALLLSGEIFMISAGTTRPGNIELISSSNISGIGAFNRDIESFTINSGAWAGTYTKTSEYGIYSNGEINLIHYLIQRDQNTGRGISPTTQILTKILHMDQLDKANTSTLEKSGSLSGIFHLDKGVGDDALQEFKEEINNTIRGAGNHGRLAATTSDVQYTDLSSKTIDMNFSKLSEASRIDIANHFRIPLAIISEKASTLNNYAESRKALLIEAVMPNVQAAYNALSKCFNVFGIELHLLADGRSAPEVQSQRLSRALELQKIGVFTPNEIREAAGYEAIDLTEIEDPADA